MNHQPTPYDLGISEDPRDTWADAGQAERARADAIRLADAETTGWRTRGNVYVAQGRTVDTGHLVISEGMTRDMLYVGMTRGRQANTAHVVTGNPDPSLPSPGQVIAAPETVIRAAAAAEADREPEAGP